MNRFLAKIITSVIPSKPMRKRARNSLSGPVKTPHIRHKIYGKIYMPYYNRSAEIDSAVPQIYSAEGRRMDMFFLRDLHSAHIPGLAPSKYFLWDRFNFGLDTHFYSHNAMLEQMGSPSRKYGMLIETPSMVPRDYKIFRKHPSLAQDFDAIFTYDAEILETVSNAKFAPFPADLGVFYPRSKISAGKYLQKTRRVSMVSSHKRSCPLHNLRYDLAHYCKNRGLADTFGTFDGGPRIDTLADVYDSYMYSIIVENDIRPYQFSERLTAAFCAMTIPVYIGASRIGEFFNTGGMVLISPDNAEAELAKALPQCTPGAYQARLEAVKDNFERVQQYISPFDAIYERYLAR